MLRSTTSCLRVSYTGASSANPADLGDEDRVALGSVLLEMMERIDLVTASGPIANIDQKSARAAILTPRGETLVRFIEPIAAA